MVKAMNLSEDELYEVQALKRKFRRRLCLIAFLVALLAIGLGILIGYFIGREVRGNELEDAGREPSIQEQMKEKEELHKKAVEGISAERLRENLRFFTKVPHAPGSKVNYDYALHIKDKWESYGFDKVELRKYQVLLSFPEKPGVITVKNGSREVFRSSTRVTPLDPSENHTTVLPPFNAYSPAGSVTGKLVYANYARVEDFKTLAKHNINCTNKIVIGRYGGTSRIYKPTNAQEAGAIGLIIFMDPQQYAKEGMDKVYPKYNWLPDTAVQRGTVRNANFRGDPLTPGYPAIDGIYRLPMDEAKKALPRIPVHPISYKDAEPLLKLLTGSVNDSSWQGGLAFRYGVYMDSKDDRMVTLNVSTKLQLKDAYNVIGTINGALEPDKIVLLGNHRDAWIYGAADPSSGTASLMETSRGLGELLKKNWRPRRSIVLCSWGAEEPQLMGSAEWQEEFSSLLHRRTVAYLNIDMSVDGKYSFRAKSMPIMDWALLEATKKVKSPYGNETVFDEWARKLPSSTKSMKRPRLQAIRSGSDYTVFYQRIGVPCVDIRYTYDRKTAGNPLYHTIHDNFRWMSTLIDPTFEYHRVTTRVWLQLTLTLADSVILPFNMTRYAEMLNYYSKTFAYSKTFRPKLKAISVTLDDIDAAIQNFTAAAKSFQKAVEVADLKKSSLVAKLNERLVTLERAFIDHSALIPERPLQRHVVLTPSFHVYSSAFGGVAEALYRVDEGRASAEDVKKQISSVVYGIRSATLLLSLAPI